MNKRMFAIFTIILLFSFFAIGIAIAQDPMDFAVEKVESFIFNRALPENLNGYIEEEYIAQGTSNDYAFGPDNWTVEVTATDQNWRTRFMVRKPAKPRNGNGIVMIEWLNPTATWDGTPMWDLTHDHIVREGIVWVGVSIKPVVLDFLMGGANNPFGLAPKPNIAIRYAGLDLFMGSRDDFSGEGLAWDMMNQLTAYLRDNGPSDHPLYGFNIEHVMQSGYSQSGGYLITHSNFFHQDTTDSYFIAAAGGAHQITFDDSGYGWPDERAFVHPIEGVPIVRWQSETEVVAFGIVNLRPQVQDEWYRWWEIAGGAHAPVDPGEEKGYRDVVGFTGFGDCANPFPQRDDDPVQTRFVGHSTIALLDAWVRKGKAPPPNQFLEVVDIPPVGFVELARDEFGNALGGIRLPAVEVPIATYSGINSGGGFCFLFGSLEPFDEEMLDELYRNHGWYVFQVRRAIRQSLTSKFLLRPDAKIIQHQAATSDIGR